MLRKSKLLIASVVATTALAVGAGPASAQQQEGLVNIIITDVTVQVPVSVAANLCDINVAILATQERAGGAECDADARSVASSGPGDQDGMPTEGDVEQDGLVNVFISDVIAQIPISVAANICDVNVGVLAQQLRVGETTCEADAVSIARTPGRSGGGGGGA
jgi:hypothetical protein